MARPSTAASYELIGARGAAVDPDVALMMALRDGDDSAFAELVARHQARIITLIYRFVGNEAEAEDLAQEVFLRIYRTRDRYWSQQLGEVRRMTNRTGEVRFYYSGMAQAVLLDRFAPGWKAQAWSQGVWLEDLLDQAIQ